MSKRNNDHLSISDLLKDFVYTNNLQSGLDKVNVKSAWNTMMGPGVSNYTTAIKLQGSVLYVKFSSSVLREELSYGKSKIIEMLNSELGRPIISDIIFA